MNNCRWNLKPPVPAASLPNFNGLPLFIAQILYNRGITSAKEAEVFLAADSRLAADPLKMPDVNAAVARIYRALLSGEKMAVYGDFDADGITATAVMVSGLIGLGGEAIPYIPHRINEGYGLKTETLKKLKDSGIGLVISVDCGITALPEIKEANQMGLDVIITDHHTPLEELPEAIASINPRRADSAYPFKELAGVGVAFKLLVALYQGSGKEEQLDELLDLVAIGTIADIMPLTGENRYLVKRGLERINASPRPGISELINQSRVEAGKVESNDISWVLAPRLNAAGRLEHAMAGYQLLMAESMAEAREMASWLETKNAERQQLTIKFHTSARDKVLEEGVAPLLVAESEECPEGILGLVAGRLTDEFYRPSIAVKIKEDSATGSARSIPEFNIISAINQCGELLSHFGGHAQAAGFTLPVKNLPLFTKRLTETAAIELADVELRPHLDIDTETRLAQLNGKTLETIQKLAPFGKDNPAPTFLSRNVNVAESRTMGNNGQHLRLKLKQEGSIWGAVCFRAGDCPPETLNSPIDVVYNLELDRWRGKETLRLNILDFAPTGQFI